MPAPGCGLPGRATSAHHAWSSVATHPTRPMIARRPLVYPSTVLQSPSRHVRPPDVHAHLGWPRACSPSKTAKVISSKATVLGQVLYRNAADGVRSCIATFASLWELMGSGLVLQHFWLMGSGLVLQHLLHSASPRSTGQSAGRIRGPIRSRWVSTKRKMLQYKT